MPKPEFWTNNKHDIVLNMSAVLEGTHQHTDLIKEMFWRASKYVERYEHAKGMRYYKAAEIVIAHNHPLTEDEVYAWQHEWDGIGASIVDRITRYVFNHEHEVFREGVPAVQQPQGGVWAYM